MDINNLKCRKCGAPVSADMKKCPKCDAPILLKLMQEEAKRQLPAKKIREKNKRMENEYKKAAKAKERRLKKGKKSVFFAAAMWIISIIVVIAASLAIHNITKNKIMSDTAIADAVSETVTGLPSAAETEETESEEPVLEETVTKEASKDVPKEAPKKEEQIEEAPKKQEPEKVERQITRNSYIFPSNSQKLSEEDLKGLSQYDTGLIRNEIFARKGYVFQKEPYKSYFNSQAWYTPATANNISLNEIEKYNNDFIIEYEKAQGWR